MPLHENLKTIRLSKGLSQEDMAAKLEYGSINGYAKVERGETFPKMDKLKKMAEILKTDVENLLGSNGGSVVNIKNDCRQSYQGQNIILLSESQCAHELEKSQLLLQERDKEIAYLKKMLALLESVDKS